MQIDNVVVYNSVTGIPAGSVIDVSDYSLGDGNTHTMNLIRANSSMKNKQVSMTAYLTDTSYKGTTFSINH